MGRANLGNLIYRNPYGKNRKKKKKSSEKNIFF